MNNYFNKMKKKLMVLLNNSKFKFYVLKISGIIAILSTILAYFLLKKKKSKKFILPLIRNNGFIDLLKRDIFSYISIGKQTSYFNLPSGLVNKGNDCYINVLTQV